MGNLSLAMNDNGLIRRFHALYDKVYRADILSHAWALSVPTRAAPGLTASLSRPVNACWREWEQLGIVTKVTGQKRNRLYSYVEYFRIMNEGTELPR